MSIAIWIAISIALVYAAAPITQGGLRKIDEKQLAKYVSKRGLPLPVQLREPLMRRIRATEKTAITAGCIGLGIGALVALLLEVLGPESSSWGALAMGGATIGGALGGYFSARRGQPLLPQAPRVARSVETTVDDYVSAGERRAFRWVPWVVIAGIVAAWVWWALLPARAEGHWLLMGVATVVPLLLLGSWALLGPAMQRLLDSPQHATTDLELAWDDATRSDAMRGLQDVGITAGLAGPLVSLLVIANLVLDQVTGDAMVWMGLGAFVTGLVLWGVLLVPYAEGRTLRNPSLKLWRGTTFGGATGGATGGAAA